MRVLDILFPKRCVGCGKIGKYFCTSCSADIRVIKPNESICPMCEKPVVGGVTHPSCQTRYSLDGLTSFFHYDGPVRKAIKAMKYSLTSDVAEEFIRLVPASNIPKGTFIPIPLHQKRFRQRGFNQAEVLATILAKRLNQHVRTDILKRVRETVPQVAMKKRDARMKNMEGVFGLIHDDFKQRDMGRVLLFDDVFTTGATMRSAANVLKQAGVKQVWAVTMAR